MQLPCSGFWYLPPGKTPGVPVRILACLLRNLNARAHIVSLDCVCKGRKNSDFACRELACLAKTESEHVLAGKIKFSDDILSR